MPSEDLVIDLVNSHLEDGECPSCGGTGWADEHEPCRDCYGSGEANPPHEPEPSGVIATLFARLAEKEQAIYELRLRIKELEGEL